MVTAVRNIQENSAINRNGQPGSPALLFLVSVLWPPQLVLLALA